MEILNCLIIGNDSFTLSAAKKIFDIGHNIAGIITESRDILKWANEENIKIISAKEFNEKNIYDYIFCFDMNLADVKYNNKNIIRLFCSIPLENIKLVYPSLLKKMPSLIAGWNLINSIGDTQLYFYKSFVPQDNKDSQKLYNSIFYYLLESLSDLIIDLSRQQINLKLPSSNNSKFTIPINEIKKYLNDESPKHQQIMKLGYRLITEIYKRYTFNTEATTPLLPFLSPNEALDHVCQYYTVKDNEEKIVSIFNQKIIQCAFQEEKFEQEILIPSIIINISYAEKNETLHFSFNTNVPENYRYISQHLHNLWKELLNNTASPLDCAPIITIDELKLLDSWNKTEKTFLYPETIHEAFEKQVETTPYHLAICYNEHQITYIELNKLSNQLAHYISIHYPAHLEKNEPKIGLCISRGINQIAGILAILKAGGVYIPFDPSYPDERLSFILNDTNAEVIITDNLFLETHGDFSSSLSKKIVINIDTDNNKIQSMATANIDKKNINSNNLAYIIYTSGSTGNPKGVMIEHGSLINLIGSETHLCNINNKSRILQIASIGFDAAGWDIYGALLNGASLFIANDDVRISASELHSYVKNHEITFMTLTPAILALMPKVDLPHLKTLVVMGDLSDAHYLNYWNSNRQLFNGYGPTEATIGATLFEYKQNESAKKIGRPFNNYKIYITDRFNNLVPIGTQGELCIGGIGVARGYWQHADLTKDKFVKCPFAINEKYNRMYKTGDVARWLPDGNIEFLGRLDDQVKIRGVRIELSEVEDLLSKNPVVKQCAVVARGHAENKHLVAYWASNNAARDLKTERIELKKYLQNHLPPSAVPSFFVYLEKFPLTPNGKINKKVLKDALPEDSVNEQEYVAPRDETEIILSDIFCKVLNLEKVGIYDNFFALGGHSLTATQIATRLSEQLNIECGVRVIFEHPSVIELGKYLANIELDNKINKDFVQKSDTIPLTFSQRRLWYIHQFEPEDTAYNLPFALQFEGNLKIDALETSFNYLIGRHECLRTLFINKNGVPIQIIQPPYSVTFKPHLIKEKDLNNNMTEFTNICFDLEQGPLMRLRLYKLSPEKYVLLTVKHNIITDAWSEGVIAKEVNTIYSQIVSKQAPHLPPIQYQCSDIAMYLENSFTRDTLQKQLLYWRQKLDNYSELVLATDFVRPAILTNKGKKITFSFTDVSLEKLKQLSLNFHSTLFMSLISALNVLFMRYSGQNDIILGTAAAGRNHKNMEEVIGFFVNTLPLRFILDPEASFEDTMKMVRDTCWEAFSNQDVPFEWLVEQSSFTREVNKTPLFQVMVILQNANEGFEFNLPDVTCQQIPVESNASMFDMTWNFSEGHDYLQLNLDYATDLYQEETIYAMIRNFQELLVNLLNVPSQKISKVSLLSQNEKERLRGYMYGPVRHRPNMSLAKLLENISQKYSDHIALTFQEQKLTYRELNELSNQLTHYLIKFSSTGTSKCIGIMMERSIEMIVAFIAILKTGFSYLPLDPDYPIDRLEYMIEDSKVEKVLTQTNVLNLEGFSPATRGKFILTDKIQSEIDQLPKSNVNILINPQDLAYIIYTSGSTGKPKGVKISQESVINLVLDFTEKLNCSNKDRLLSITTISFDIFYLELFMPLISGAELILADKEVARNPVKLVNFLNEIKPSIMQATPTMWSMIVDHIETGQLTALCGGEAMSPQLLSQLQKTVKELWNVYGPTETTIWSTAANLSNAANPYIGKPLTNTSCYVVDNYLNLVPVGSIGELYIGGLGIAKGYHNRSELTEEKFIKNLFPSPYQDAILYKTGDLVRWNSKGNIEYKGRTDFQIKIRGSRIELGEIEEALRSFAGIEKCIVHAHGEGNDKRLVAYFILNETYKEPSHAELREFLEKRLPSTMVPSGFMCLKEFPLTSNHKIDRKKLPIPDQQFALSQSLFIEPEDEIEEKIQKIWQDILKLDKISVEENFFNAGGHSLHIPQIVSKINEVWVNKKITIRSFILNSTVRELKRFLLKEEG